MIHWKKLFFDKDGPTLIAKTKSDPEQVQRHNNLIKSYQSIIKENGKGISDLEEYITHELNAIEVKVTEQELYLFMKNVLVNKVIVRPARNREKDVKEYHGKELWDEITIAYGVFKEDIELATPRFVEYIYALEHKNRG